MKRILSNRYPALAFRFYIGGIFIYASMYKINYPAEFAENIASYQLAPFWSVNLLAMAMPWIELVCGVLLVVGIRSKSALAVIMGMLVLFTVAVTLSLIRNIPIGCGCFSSVGESISWMTVVRDLVWLVMSIHVYYYDSDFQLENRFLLAIKDA